MDSWDRIRWEMRLSFGLPRQSSAVIRPEGLPDPLQKVAEDMYDAKSDDEAKAAAQEFLLLSEEWTSKNPPTTQSKDSES